MKSIFFIFFSLCTFHFSLSQESHFGLKGGVNFANITENNLINNVEIKPSILVGLFANKKMNENIGIQVELLYSRQGFNSLQREFKIDYLNVPFILKYFFFKGLNIQIGSQFGVLLNERRYINGILYNIDNYDISIVGGIGYEMSNGLRFETRYNYGINDISPSFGTDIKNRVISLTLGYSFF